VTDATERLVNLALYLAAARGPVTRERIRTDVAGYPPTAEQDDAAFARMLERDKKDLRAAGLVIESDSEGNYRLDPGATFASGVTLTPEEAAAVRAVGVALLADPSFPFAEELRFALAKIATALETPESPVRALTADEQPRIQGTAVGSLSDAITANKGIAFGYTNSLGETKSHSLEPYGLFARDGRWYLVGRDTALDETRTYTVGRMRDLSVNPAKPETPDFERPADFDVASFIGLPFQYGPSEFTATVAFEPGEAWRAAGLAVGKGELTPNADGGATWHVSARDRRRLMRWVIENGPGISVLDPADVARELGEGLRAAALVNGGGDRG